MPTELVLVVLLLPPLAWAIIIWCWRATVNRCWQEPVLRRPVLVIESDDWGPGPDWHAERLAQIRQCLARHRDTEDRPAVMTLGVVLAAPDTEAMGQNDLSVYHRTTLADVRCHLLLEQMQAGSVDGVFALQLHGMEHYWPPALLHAAREDERLQAWLTGDIFPPYEALPPALQSRWLDGSRLPSQPLSVEEIQLAVAEETAAWQLIFGQSTRVVVPPTFVWTREVEAAWVAAGIKVIITPGRRYTYRDMAGLPAAEAGELHNGQIAAGEACYLVRDIYFEPERGHTAEQALEQASRRFLYGRPALLETHRSNFIGSESEFLESLARMDELLCAARRRWPGLTFLSPEALARIYRDQPEEWCARDLGVRLHLLLRRLETTSRLRKLAWFTGLVVPAVIVRAFTASAARRAGVAA